MSKNVCGLCGTFYNPRCPHWPACYPAAEQFAMDKVPAWIKVLMFVMFVAGDVCLYMSWYL